MKAHYMHFQKKHAIIKEAGLDNALFKKEFLNIASQWEDEFITPPIHYFLEMVREF